MQSYWRHVGQRTLWWTTRWAVLSACVGIILMVARVPLPDSGSPPTYVGEYLFWPIVCILTIPVVLVISLVLLMIVSLDKRHMNAATATGKTIFSPSVSMCGSLVLLACAFVIGIFGLSVSENTPMWHKDVRLGTAIILGALLLGWVGVAMARSSIRELRSSRRARLDTNREQP